MHEYSLVQALVGRVAEEARARGAVAVRRVRVRIGDVSGVDPDLFATAYETFCPGTVCAGAPLEVSRTAARWECGGCGRSIAAGELLRCPTCGVPARLAQGDEILLDQLELEVA
jgi:hydrogenase nickel incorporation protein HypA/HybF